MNDPRAFLRSRRASALIASLFIFVFACFARAEVAIRLVDSRDKAPLEYWTREQPLPAGGKIYYVMPQKFYVDGNEFEFAHWGDKKGEALESAHDKGDKGDKKSDDGMDDIVTEMGGGGPPEPEVNSDRKLEVVGGTGIKALIIAPSVPGEHVIEPGGLRFTVNDKTAIAKADESLVINSTDAMSMLCHPVDLNIIPEPKGAPMARVRVLSGGKQIVEQMADIARPAVVRLYLPLSTTGYSIEVSNVAMFDVVLDKDGAKLKGTPKLEGDATVTADGFAISVVQKSATQLLKVAVAEVVAAPELYAFIDRNRSVFMEGERVEVSLRAFGNGGANSAAVSLTGADGKAMSLGEATLRKSGSVASAEFVLDTALLRPGKYQLKAGWNSIESNPLPIEIAPAMPTTDMKLFVTTKWGKFGMEQSTLDTIAGAGFNLYSQQLGNGGAHGPQSSPLESWRTPRQRDASRLKQFQKANFPPELTNLPLPEEAAVERLLSQGVHWIPNLYGSTSYMILYFNAGNDWLDHAEDRYQSAQHLGMAFRRFPNFDGMIYCTGDGPTPATSGSVFGTAGISGFDVIHERRMKKLGDMFEAAYGKVEFKNEESPALTQRTEKDIADQAQRGGAWGFRVGEDIKGVTVQGDAQKKFVWSQWINDLYPNQFREHRAALAEMIDNPIVNCGASWGIGAGGGMYPGTFYRDLDNPLNDQHGDYGLCNFNYYTGSDILNMGLTDKTQRTWEGLDLITNRTPQSGWKIFLEALSRNPAGMGVLNLDSQFCGWGENKSNSEDLTLITEISKQLGDTFMNLQGRPEIGVVSSFRQEATEGQPFRSLYAAHFISSKSGYQTDVVSDVMIEAQPEKVSQRYKALVLFRMSAPITPALKASLAAFQAKGGLLIVDEGSTKIDLPNLIKLPFTVPADRGPNNMVDHLEFEQFFEPYIAQFTQAVSPKLKPALSTGNPHVTGVQSGDGDLTYVTIFNDTKPQMDNGVESQFYVAPTKATIEIAKTGAVYNVLEQRPVDAKAAGKGVSFDVDMTHFPGAVLLITPRPIAKLEVRSLKQVSPGQLVQFRARALDDAGAPIAGKLPVEFTITDPAGQVRYQLYRTTEVDLNLKIAGNDPAGEWKWMARELATGLVARGQFTVAGELKAPTIATRNALVYDGSAVHDFLHGREFEIVLYPQQTALLETAAALQKSLEAKGLKARVKMIWPSDLRNYPMQWDYLTIEDREIRESILDGDWVGTRIKGKNQNQTYETDPLHHMQAFYGNYAGSGATVYYKDVILLGRGDVASNPMLDTIQYGQMLGRNVSESYPAAGSGIVAYAWSPFHFGNDAIVVWGRDEAGLGEAIGSLTKLAEAKERPAKDFIPVVERKGFEHGQVFAAMGLAAPGDAQAAARVTISSAEREPASMLPTVYARAIGSVTIDDAGRVFIDQTPLSDPANPTLAMVDLGKAAAQQFTLHAPIGPGNAISLARFFAQDQKGAWPDANVVRVDRRWYSDISDYWRGLPSPSVAPIRTDKGWIVPVGSGVGLYDESGKSLWFFDPFGTLQTYPEGKYPRIVQAMSLSGDGQWLAVSFYDSTPMPDGFGIQNRGDVVILEAATGKVAGTAIGYAAGRVAISKDGSRLVAIDEQTASKGETRREPNPHDRTTLGVFNRTGKEIKFVPIDPPVDTMRVDDGATLALLSYRDTRKSVSVVDLTSGTISHHSYPRIDRGLAVAPDGAFAVVSYSDNTVHKLGRDGAVVYQVKLASSGKPMITPKGQVFLAGDDGMLYALDDSGKVTSTTDFGKAASLALDAKLQSPPIAQLVTPQETQLWNRAGDKNAKLLKITPLTFANVQKELTIAKGNPTTLTLDAPVLAAWEEVVVEFTYQLQDASDELTVTFDGPDAKPQTARFPAAIEPRVASFALRPKAAGPVKIALSSASGATVRDVKAMRVQLTGAQNVARTARPGEEGGNPDNVVGVYIPNVLGKVGDPREEQMAYGIDPKAASALGVPETDKYAPVDGRLYTATPLYETFYARSNLRSAGVVIEFDRPRSIRGIGLWEDMTELPTQAFALEYCDSYKIDNQFKQLNADWKTAFVYLGNTDYFHLHTFPAIKAKIWRYTILATPAKAQRIAEIELYEEEVEDVLDMKGLE